jgi:hypothetical protein
MLAFRFGDIDWKRRVIVLRGETTKSRKTHPAPIATARLRSVLEWLRLEADGQEARRGAALQRRDRRTGGPIQNGVGHRGAEGPRREARVEGGRLDRADAGMRRAGPTEQPALARHAARVRFTPSRERRPSRPGARSRRSRLNHHDRAVRQPRNWRTFKQRLRGWRAANLRRVSARE